jgi:hypothetical protein
VVAALICWKTGSFRDLVYEAEYRANRKIVASPGKDVYGRPEFSYRVMGSDLAPEISI